MSVTTTVLILSIICGLCLPAEYDRFAEGELKVEVLQEAEECPLKAQDDDKMYVHYKGMFLDGKVFDSSIPKDRPYVFVLGTGSVIQAYEIGVQGMCEGEKRRLTAPPKYAYGSRGYGDLIPPYATLVFEVELLKIVRKGQLKVDVLEFGEERDVQAQYNDRLYIHYTGSLENGHVFDSSIPKNRPYVFVLGLGQVIQGYEQALPGMCVGDKWRLTVPPHLAYGERGTKNIPPDSTLTFDVELLRIDREPEVLEVEVLKDPSEDCTVKTENFDKLHVHYTGMLWDGTIFDSSIPLDTPYVFVIGTGSVIQGYEEGLLNMCEGEQRRLTVPPDYAYGPDGYGDIIPPQTTLVFEVELLKIVKKGELKVEIMKEPADNCTVRTKNNDRMYVHYKGSLEDGTVFDSSIPRNQPYIFVLGLKQVIPGYEQGLQDMCVGEQRKLTVPPHMAYGETGDGNLIPPGATLTFEVELLRIDREPEKLVVEIKERPESECKMKSQNFDRLYIHYTGRLWDGSVFDSSIPGDDPYVFVLGTGSVIQGYEKGLLNMCEGEVRRLTIPYNLAYGEEGYPSVIPPYATLVFEVELMKIERRSEL